MAATIQNIEFPKKPRALDTSGNNNHGKIYSGRALEFDGVTDYFQNNGGASLTGVNSFANGVSWTFACWMYFDSAGDGEDHFIGHDSTTQNHLTFNHSSNILRFRDNSADYYTFSSTSLNEDTWYRIAITTDGTKLTAYANGIVYGTIEANQANDDADDNFDNTTMEFSGWGCPYTSEGNRAGHFMGMMSDGQVWDATWSADDAAYDFANPESLALNASGTALTESNLKVWYPMQDGHRGQQSYVLDGANTGLVRNIWDGTQGDITNWTALGSNTIATDNGAVKVAYSNVNTGAKIELRDSKDLSEDLTVGATYKITFKAKAEGGTTIDVLINGPETYIASNIPDDPTTFSSYEGYFVASHATDNSIRFNNMGTDDVVWIKDIAIYPINNKHHATTVFFGDESVTNGTFETDTSGWVDISGTTFERNTSSPITGSGDLHWAQSATDAGHTGVRWNTAITFVAGRTYRLTYTYRVVGTPDIFAKISDDNSPTGGVLPGFTETALNATSNTDVSHTFTAGASGDYYFMFRTENNHAAEIFVDDISLKEVGVASGWTDADQQLDIAQPALQSYNELAWFPGVDPGGSTDYSINCTSGASIDNVWVGGGTASAWIFPNSMGEGDKGRVFDKTFWHIHLITLSGDACKIRFEHGRDTANHTTTIDNHNIQLGEWNHIAITYDKSSPSTVAKIYVNGVLRDATVVAGSGTISNDAASTLYIGNTSSGSKTFGGCITEASLWTNTLTATEVLELYNEGKALDATLHSSYVSAASDLKGYWRNNGLSTWTDLSDNSNNGTVNNITETLLIPQGVDGSRCSQGFIMNKSRNTSSFNKPDDGDVSHVQKSTSPVTGSNAMTLSAWIKPKRVGSTFEGFVTMGDHAANKSFWIGLFGNGNYGGGINGGNIDTGDAAVAGDWVHLALTYAGGSSGALILYKNGVADGNTTCTAAIPTNDTAYVRVGSIGVTGEANNYPATSGQVDGVLIYNKALSATEVLRNYKATKGSHRN